MGRRHPPLTSRVVASGLAVTASWAAVRSDRSARFDDVVAAAIRRPLGPRVDQVVGAATDLGSVYGLTGMAAALWVTGRRRAAVDVFGSGMTAWVVAQSAKPLLDRPRPYQEAEAERLVAEPAGSSWPSGHSAVAAAIATAAHDHGGGRVATATGVALVGFVAASRIYVGVHHATDPVAGAGIGVLSATGWQAVSRRLRNRRARRRDPDRTIRPR